MSWLDLRSPPASNRQLLGRVVAGYLVALIVVGLVSYYIFGQSSWRFMVTIALGSGTSAVVTYRGQEVAGGPNALSTDPIAPPRG